MTEDTFNPLARRVLDSVVAKHCDWYKYAETREGGDLELAVPAPQGSRAGSLVIFTARGEDIWIRYAPPHVCYSISSDDELHMIVDALLRDDAFFAVVSNGDEWVETTLLRPGEEPVLANGQVANMVSWSGLHDRIVTYNTSHRITELDNKRLDLTVGRPSGAHSGPSRRPPAGQPRRYPDVV